MDRTRCARFQRFIGVQTQNPISGCFVDRGVLLRRVALPFFDEDFRAEGFRDLDGAVGRARVDDDNFTFAVGDQWLHAGERAPDVSLFVVSDDHDREDHAGLLLLSTRACRAVLGLDGRGRPSPHELRACRAALGLDGRGRPSPHELRSLPSCARLGRAGAPVPTQALPISESFTERGYARGAMWQKKNAAKGKRRAGTPGAPSKKFFITVAVAPEEVAPALAGRLAAPTGAEYSERA